MLMRMAVKTTFMKTPILTMVKKKELRFLRRAGGYVRTVAQRSMKNKPDYRDKSKEGTPPNAHNKALKRSILYGVDLKTDSVVIGVSNNVLGSAAFLGNKIGKLHERGGRANVRLPGRRGKNGKRKKGPTVRARFQPRPFMAPALDVSQPKLRDILYDTFS